MSSRARTSHFPFVVVEGDAEQEESSTDEEDDDEHEDIDYNNKLNLGIGEEESTFLEDFTVKNHQISHSGVSANAEDSSSARGKKDSIVLKKVCKVCKRSGHEAGFKGATYIDCPMKPCFLCKTPGHTTINCPHRVAAEHGVIPAPHRNTSSSLDFVFQRQFKSKIRTIKAEFVIPDKVTCGVIRYHSRRITCIEFHPRNNNILLSADKKGQLGVWDYEKVHEKTVYGNIHSCLLNTMRFASTNEDSVYTASSDGTASCTDLVTGIPSYLLDLNPNGWQGPTCWKMLYGMDINSEKHLLLVADNSGFLYMVDTRSRNKSGDSVLIHKKGSKVVGIHCNPFLPDLLISCGNDHYARIWDIRRLQAGSSLQDLAHSRVVNSAYFSPISGCKIVTTSQDNRISIWDSIFGDLSSPSRQIVHSHDFNRHLTPFRAEWDPKDPSESLIVIGRYISENYNGTALHPIDFIDGSSGRLVAEVMDPNITTITTVNKLHPRDPVLASGSSRSLLIWRPKSEDGEEQDEASSRIVVCGDSSKMKGGKKKKKNGSDYDDSDNDNMLDRGKKITKISHQTPKKNKVQR